MILLSVGGVGVEVSAGSDDSMVRSSALCTTQFSRSVYAVAAWLVTRVAESGLERNGGGIGRV